MSELQSSRVVFDVSLEGRARKVVTLRSALMVRNKMELPVEIRLQGFTSMEGKLIHVRIFAVDLWRQRWWWALCMTQMGGNNSNEEEEIIPTDWVVQRNVGALKNLVLTRKDCFLPQSSATTPYEPAEVFHGARLGYWRANEVSI